MSTRSGQTPLEAHEVLARYWDGGTFPVPVARIANAMGARVELSNEIEDSGVVQRLDDGFLIEVKAGEPVYRRRFTIAHEIGHIALGHLRTGQPLFRDANFNRPRDYREIAANRFAAALLMPAKYVRLAWGKIPYRQLAEAFGVAEQTMLYRLVQLEIIDARHVRRSA
jgi:Zn-dependent peptidase ImmA (M78 family)